MPMSFDICTQPFALPLAQDTPPVRSAMYKAALNVSALPDRPRQSVYALPMQMSFDIRAQPFALSAQDTPPVRSAMYGAALHGCALPDRCNRVCPSHAHELRHMHAAVRPAAGAGHAACAFGYI